MHMGVLQQYRCAQPMPANRRELDAQSVMSFTSSQPEHHLTISLFHDYYIDTEWIRFTRKRLTDVVRTTTDGHGFPCHIRGSIQVVEVSFLKEKRKEVKGAYSFV